MDGAYRERALGLPIHHRFSLGRLADDGGKMAAAHQVGHAMVLTGAFDVVRVLETEGAAGLRAVHCKPLAPARPAAPPTGSRAPRPGSSAGTTAST